MIADSEKDHPDHVYNEAGLRVLKSSFIYGANGSGKSNFVKAIQYSKSKIIDYDEFSFQNNVKFSPDLSYNNSTTTAGTPSYFEYILAIDGKKYLYGLEINSLLDLITSEWLYEIIDDDNMNVIFALDRSKAEDDEECSVPSLKRLIPKYRKENNGGTFLYYTSVETSNDIVESLFDWFDCGLIVRTADFMDCMMSLETGSFEKMIKILNGLDTGIIGFEDRYEPISVQDPAYKEYELDFESSIITENQPDLTLNDLLNRTDVEKAFRNPTILLNKPNNYSKHETRVFKELLDYGGGYLEGIVFTGNTALIPRDTGGKNTLNQLIFKHEPSGFEINYNDESLGTRRLVYLLSLMMIGKCCGRTVVIDELECSLHTLLTKELIKLFYKGYFECDQLIVTTHEDALIDEEISRHDEIWFVDRQDNHDDSGSELYSLVSFKEKYKDSRWAYLFGKFAAIPEFKIYPEEDE